MSNIEQGILEIKNTAAKEATLITKVTELKAALNTIDFTVIEQAIQIVESVTAKEATLTQGIMDVITAIENIDFTELENSIAEVKNAVANIDFSTLAKEDTLNGRAEEILDAIGNSVSQYDDMIEMQLRAIIGRG